MATTLDADLNVIQSAPLDIALLDGDLSIISKLDDEPNDVGGLTSAELKARFDQAGNTIKTYLNETLIPALLAADATEKSRGQAEALRVQNEEDRKTGEAGRVSAESGRVLAEELRVRAEEDRAAEAQGMVDQARNSAEQATRMERRCRDSLVQVNESTFRAYEFANQAQAAAELAPKVENGTWWVRKNGKYEDTGVPAQGKTPVRGVDYWTAADREQIVQEVLAALGK